MANRTWHGATDGDYATAGNWLEGSVPTNGDNVRIPATSTRAIVSSLNQSAVTLGDFIVEEGAPAIGVDSSATYLQIGLSGAFRFAGAGTALIDLGSSNIVAQVDATATPATGYCGLYLKGSSMSVLAINGGYVGLAWRMGETATATTIRVNAASCRLWAGSGVTNTTTTVTNGTYCGKHGITTLNVMGGIAITTHSGAITTANSYGGYFYPNSTGTITTLNVLGGIVDFTTCGAARTVTNWKHELGTLKADEGYVTLTNRTTPTGANSYVASRIVTT